MYKYRVEFAHQDDTADEVLQHGKGTIEINTDKPVETQAEKNEVARAIGLELGKTKIAVLQIIPLEVGEVVIDYADSLDPETLEILESVPDITSFGKNK